MSQNQEVQLDIRQGTGDAKARLCNETQEGINRLYKKALTQNTWTQLGRIPIEGQGQGQDQNQNKFT